MSAKKELKSYLQSQISQGQDRLANYVKDNQGNTLPKRDVFESLREYALRFYDKRSDPRIIVMPGLRGVGKTTLLAQLFMEVSSFGDVSKIYLSTDEIVKRFEANLWDVLDAYEELSGENITKLKNPLFLFLDEIHYDKKWASFLKTVYDRSRNVMVFCTGSAAILLKDQIGADLARRSFSVDIHPVDFTEYLSMKEGKNVNYSLKKELKKTLMQSNSAQELFDRLNKCAKEVKEYWLETDRFEIQKFLEFGTFPFAIKAENKPFVVEYIGQILNKIIYLDIPQFSKFETETLNKIERILYLISDSIAVSQRKLGEAVDLQIPTLSALLGSLEKAGVLLKISPYGAHYKQIRKPSKYLFASPSLRYFFLNSKSSIRSYDDFKGSLLEDAAAMYLNRILPNFGLASLTYDVSEIGADFVLKNIDKKIAIEIGYGNKGIKQVSSTLERIKGDLGIIISNSDLNLENDKIIKLPLEWFLLM